MGVLDEGRTGIRVFLSSTVEHKIKRVVALIYSVVSLQEGDTSMRE
jgi:hypothetical protein